MWLGVYVCAYVFELVCENTPVNTGVLVFTWQPIRKGSDAGGSGERGGAWGGGRRVGRWGAADITHCCRDRDRKRRAEGTGKPQTHERVRREQKKKVMSDHCLHSRCGLQDGRPASAASPWTNAVKMSSVCVGWATAHLIMKCVYPPLTTKVVTQAFVCPELCLFQLRATLPDCYSQWPHHFCAQLPSQTGADSQLSWLSEDLNITASVMDTPQIFPQLTPGVLSDGKGTWEDGSQSSSLESQWTIWQDVLFREVVKGKFDENQCAQQWGLECTHLLRLTLLKLDTSMTL